MLGELLQRKCSYYRLGALGFMYGGDDEYPGNLGIYDQIEALKWVRSNIPAFGGDPDRITVFGESAGSISTGILLMSPLSTNLFRNAILMSGSPFNPLMTQTKTWSLIPTLALASRVGCFDKLTCPSTKLMKKVPANIMECLRKTDANKLIAEQDAISSSTMPFAPFHGTDILPKSPHELVHEKNYKSRATILVGIVTYEGSVVEDGLNRYPELKPIFTTGTKEQWRAAMKDKLRELPVKPSHSAEVADYYFNLAKDDPVVSRKTYSTAFGDFYLGCPTLIQGELMSSENDVYSYHFSYKSISRGAHSGYNSICDKHDGVCHATELQFLFGAPFFSNAYDDNDRTVSREMIKLWSGVAKNDALPWPKHFKASNIVVSTNYEINPLVRDKLSTDFNYVACEIWKPFLV